MHTSVFPVNVPLLQHRIPLDLHMALTGFAERMMTWTLVPCRRQLSYPDSRAAVTDLNHISTSLSLAESFQSGASKFYKHGNCFSECQSCISPVFTTRARAHRLEQVHTYICIWPWMLTWNYQPSICTQCITRIGYCARSPSSNYNIMWLGFTLHSPSSRLDIGLFVECLLTKQ